MPITKNAHLRFQIMDSLLSTGGTYSKKEILEKLEDAMGFRVSGFTFDKDLKCLRDSLRAPIIFETRNGYYYSDKKFRLFNKPWSKDDLSALDFAYEALNTLNNIDLAEEAQAVLLSLTNRMSDRKEKPGKRIIYRPPSPPVKGVEWLPDLYEAIDQEKAITIKYYKLQTRETKTYTLSPYFLRQYNDMWYVVAWCARRELTLVFALDRIRDIRTANVNYYHDPKFEADQYFKYSFGITHSYYDKPQLVKFWITREAFYYLQVRPMHHSQKVLKETATRIMMQLEVIISEELVMALRGLGNKIKVIAPNSLSIKILTE